jgi:hypothetical protein
VERRLNKEDDDNDKENDDNDDNDNDDDDNDDDDVDDDVSLYSVSTAGFENFFRFIQRNGQYLMTSRENDSNTNKEDDDDVYSISSVGFKEFRQYLRANHGKDRDDEDDEENEEDGDDDVCVLASGSRGSVVITRYQSLPLTPSKVLPICVTQ